MTDIKIGNWLITDKGIEWGGLHGQSYLIAKDSLSDVGSPDRDKMYDWLVHMPEKTWLGVEDVYALNTALVFALEYFGIGFSKEISFVETFMEQQKQLGNKK